MFLILSLALTVDASGIAMGAILQQFINNVWQPLGFYSERLNPAQQKYSTYDRELLGAYKAFKYFRHMVEGREVCIYTDHKPLQYAFQQKSEKATPRQARYLDFLGQFTTDIRYIPGKENVIADALSRINALHTTSNIDYSKLSALLPEYRGRSPSKTLEQVRFYRKSVEGLSTVVRDMQHKAGGAALGLSCGARFEQPNGVDFGCGAFHSGSFDSLRSLRMTDMKHIEKGWGCSGDS